jgi:hypothetical protein
MTFPALTSALATAFPAGSRGLCGCAQPWSPAKVDARAAPAIRHQQVRQAGPPGVGQHPERCRRGRPEGIPPLRHQRQRQAGPGRIEGRAAVGAAGTETPDAEAQGDQTRKPGITRPVGIPQTGAPVSDPACFERLEPLAPGRSSALQLRSRSNACLRNQHTSERLQFVATIKPTYVACIVATLGATIVACNVAVEYLRREEAERLQRCAASHRRVFSSGNQGASRISGRSRATNWPGSFRSMEPGRNCSRATWPSQKPVFAFRAWRKWPCG